MDDALTLVKQYLPDPSQATLHFLASAISDEIERAPNPARKAKLTERRDSLLRSAAEARAPYAEQSTAESAPSWFKDAIGKLETLARIAEPYSDEEIAAEVNKSLNGSASEPESEMEAEVMKAAPKTDPSTRPDFSRAESIDHPIVGPQDFAATEKSIWAEITGRADTTQEASATDWRSEFQGMADMSKYTAKLHAEKAAKRQAELDHMAEVRRKSGIHPDWL